MASTGWLAEWLFLTGATAFGALVFSDWAARQTEIEGGVEVEPPLVPALDTFYVFAGVYLWVYWRHSFATPRPELLIGDVWDPILMLAYWTPCLVGVVLLATAMVVGELKAHEVELPETRGTGSIWAIAFHGGLPWFGPIVAYVAGISFLAALTGSLLAVVVAAAVAFLAWERYRVQLLTRRGEVTRPQDAAERAAAENVVGDAADRYDLRIYEPDDDRPLADAIVLPVGIPGRRRLVIESTLLIADSRASTIARMYAKHALDAHLADIYRFARGVRLVLVTASVSVAMGVAPARTIIGMRLGAVAGAVLGTVVLAFFVFEKVFDIDDRVASAAGRVAVAEYLSTSRNPPADALTSEFLYAYPSAERRRRRLMEESSDDHIPPRK